MRIQRLPYMAINTLKMHQRVHMLVQCSNPAYAGPVLKYSGNAPAHVMKTVRRSWSNPTIQPICTSKSRAHGEDGANNLVQSRTQWPCARVAPECAARVCTACPFASCKVPCVCTTTVWTRLYCIIQWKCCVYARALYVRACTA